MDSDLEPLIIASTEGDSAVDLGVSVRGIEERIIEGISLRNETVNDDNTKLDDMKHVSMPQHNNLDETDLKRHVSASSTQEYTVVNEHDQEDDLTGRETISNRRYVDSDLAMSDNAGSSEPWFAVNQPDQNRTGIAPPLSVGKLYHVFFSYDTEDRGWVREIVDRLESPDLGFRCSTHERNFHPGKRITENITEHITVSEKTVLVLSPDFLESPWCSFEIELGMVLSMEEKQILLVPVMIPFNLPFMDQEALSSILDMISQDKFDQSMVDLYPKTPLMSLCCDTPLCILTFLAFLVLAMMGLSLFSITVAKFNEEVERMGKGDVIGNLFFSLFMIFPVLIVILGFCRQRVLRKKTLRLKQTETNRLFLENNVLVGITVKVSSCILFRSKVTFWYYNTSECTTHLIQFLQETGESVNANCVEGAQKLAQDMIIDHSAAYTRAYTEGRLRPTHGTRHVRNAICLCQFIESKQI